MCIFDRHEKDAGLVVKEVSHDEIFEEIRSWSVIYKRYWHMGFWHIIRPVKSPLDDVKRGGW